MGDATRERKITMTARTTQHDVVQLDVLTGETAQEELGKYLAELERRGHEMQQTTTSPAGFGTDPSQRFICKHCKKSLRVYRYDNRGSFFSDFMEGDQCSERQINVMFLHERS